ncbi:PucR family transcriptional regulator [Egicoccus sp. AB-alg2]|uniref:PucR family transcriptional regulator n=1 Tax=Egicoccus sp. AB-alg2 TaxID=3242693 RepID=UPI00359F0025
MNDGPAVDAAANDGDAGTADRLPEDRDVEAEADAHLPLDLRPSASRPSRPVNVPPGWEPIAELAAIVERHLDALVERITDCIHDEIPTYRTGLVPREDLRHSVRRNLEGILFGLAEHRPPHPEEVAVRRELGSRRALQGMPVDALIQAYHVGYRELWLALVDAVPGDEPQTATQLLTTATLVWQWVHEVADALAESHASTVRSLEARAVGARQRFVELLVGGDLDGEEVPRLAGSLGFDPAGEFTVMVLRVGGDDLDAVELQHTVDRLAGRHAVVARGTQVVCVSQGGEERALTTAARNVFAAAAVALGSRRPGLRGARASLTDAELTLAVTDDGDTSTFEDAWLWATLTGADERLRPLLADGADAAGRHPHLAEAVRAFADAGFSVSQAGRRLGLHANTVAYRLDRWAELTGWDPRSFPGLTRSLAALRLAGS